jgi:hypothetical protein
MRKFFSEKVRIPEIQSIFRIILLFLLQFLLFPVHSLYFFQDILHCTSSRIYFIVLLLGCTSKTGEEDTALRKIRISLLNYREQKMNLKLLF